MDWCSCFALLERTIDAQPIGAFASKNATRGTVLCQLLLQATTFFRAAGAVVDGVVGDGKQAPTGQCGNKLESVGK